MACVVEDEANPVELYMIEPMTRAERAGYVPLCSAFLWIMTDRGTTKKYLQDTEAWAAAVNQLLPLISTAEVQIVGRPSDGGASKPIEGSTFAGIFVGEPLNDSIGLLVGDDPWLSVAPYVDSTHWDGGLNDQLFLRKATPAEWTHLQVRKSDILDRWPYPAPSIKAEADGNALPTSGESTPSALKQRILEAARELWPNGSPPARVKERDKAIAEWFSAKGEKPPNERTIRRAFQ